MSRYRVVFVARAEVQVREIDEWWRINRPAAPGLFVNELSSVLERVAASPFPGSPYIIARPKGVRRALLRRARYHAYYAIDERAEVVTVRALWHASREKEPRLR